MRRDDRSYDESEGSEEISAIETQWTRYWEALGGRLGRADRVPHTEEFKVIWPYIQQLPKGSRILDGGCGMGDWVLWLTRNGYPTLGLDVSKVTIGKLKKMFPNMEFAVADIRDTGLPANSLDAYFSWGTFEHFEEGFGRVVSEAFRILKPGAYLFTSMPFVNLRHAITATLFESWRLPPQTERVRFYQWRLTRAELATILARHGFQVEDVKMIGKRQGIQRWLQGVTGISALSIFARGFAVLAYPVVPKVIVAHMILAIARKPLEATA